MFKAGQKIGSYSLVERLGRGGFGEVWLADWETKFATTKVAVKLPLDEQVDHALIKQEAQLWARANGHPNVLPIIEANEYDGQVVIVSEYASDGSLEQLLKNNGGKLPVKQAVEITIGILSGLEFLHSRNIIHRDLKPANILLQGETPRLASFKNSRLLQKETTDESRNVTGTLEYMSPEALAGKCNVQTDIWSVGVLFYKLLSGRLPFSQKEASSLLRAIIMDSPKPLPDSIPFELKEVVARTLEKNPENRYQTLAQFRESITTVLEKPSIFSLNDLPTTDPDIKIPNDDWGRTMANPTLDVSGGFNSEDKSEVGYIQCRLCGYKNEINHVFCVNCGTNFQDKPMDRSTDNLDYGEVGSPSRTIPPTCGPQTSEYSIAEDNPDREKKTDSISNLVKKVKNFFK